jgi:lysophospholipase L1-like esterase
VSIALGANDWELTLGTIDDPETALTFYGKYQQMLNRIYARVPNAEIILHTPIWSITAKNNQIEEKRDAIFKIGRKYGYRVIDVGGNCGINKNNYTKYMLPNDGVHPNETGNNRMSVPILSDFLKIYG